MKFLMSPTVRLLARLIRENPDVPAKQEFDRIRFMERDVGLTIKVLALGSLAYFIYFSDWFEGLSHVGDLALETIRGAFLAYLIVNGIMGGVLLLLEKVPAAALPWLVLITNLVDSIFVALLVVLTGGLQSTLYWVFLFLIVRNGISISSVRNQFAMNLLVIIAYVMATVLDLAMLELRSSMSRADEHFAGLARVQVLVPARHSGKAPAAKKTAGKATTPAPLSPVVTNGVAKIGEGEGTSRASESPGPPVERDVELDFGHALWTAFGNLTSGILGEFMLLRLVLLILVAVCAYGINLLLDYQLQSEEENREFATRQHQLRSTGRLAAEIAHQLKNPLAIINNATFSLRRNLRDAPAKTLHQLDMIDEEVKRSDRILTDLMGYAKLAEGRVERLDVVEVLELARDRAFPSALDHRVEIQISAPKELPPLLMQKTHLVEILVNLFTNAREAMPDGGRIDIAVRNHRGQAIQIEFADSGPGIPVHQQDKIFEPYFSTKTQGTGLGLAIVRHNTEIYGGRVVVESELGSGTRFTLEFPAKVLTDPS